MHEDVAEARAREVTHVLDSFLGTLIDDVSTEMFEQLISVNSRWTMLRLDTSLRRTPGSIWLSHC